MIKRFFIVINKSRIKKRKKTFETNSSSAHVICVTKTDRYVTPEDLIYDMNKFSKEAIYLSGGKWRLYDIDDGYGRYPFQILIRFEDKFKYAMCEFLGRLYEDDPEWQKWYDEFEALAYELIPGFCGFDICTKDEDIYLDINGNPILHRNLIYDGWFDGKSHYTYKDENGEKHPAILDEENYYEYPNIGMIDHQSAGLLKNFLKDKKISLKEFLTNKKYYIVVDGDEYCAWESYKEIENFNPDATVEEYTKSGEDVEYLEWLKEQEDETENKTENI